MHPEDHYPDLIPFVRDAAPSPQNMTPAPEGNAEAADAWMRQFEHVASARDPSTAIMDTIQPWRQAKPWKLFRYASPWLVGLWKFREAGAARHWCCTFVYRGRYYDTQPQESPRQALIAMLLSVTFLELKHGPCPLARMDDSAESTTAGTTRDEIYEFVEAFKSCRMQSPNSPKERTNSRSRRRSKRRSPEDLPWWEST